MWLKEWADENQKSGSNDQIGKYIGIYFVFGIGSSALTVVQTLILWIFCSIEVGTTHDKTANETLDLNVDKAIGIPQAPRANGKCDFQISNVFLRYHSDGKNLEPIF